MFSPTVFVPPARMEQKVLQGEGYFDIQGFEWSIDQRSLLNPADIDESMVHAQSLSSHDPEVEALAHERIEQYWKNQVLSAPSPDAATVLRQRLIAASASLLILECECLRWSLRYAVSGWRNARPDSMLPASGSELRALFIVFAYHASPSELARCSKDSIRADFPDYSTWHRSPRSSRFVCFFFARHD